MINQSIMEGKEANDEFKPPPLDVKAPWFMYTDENWEHEQPRWSIYSVSSSPSDIKSHVKSIPQLHNKRILSSSLGWFILQDRDQRNLFSFFNPLTLQTITLPRLLGVPEQQGHLECALTSPPDTDDDYVFLLCSIAEPEPEDEDEDKDEGLLFFYRPSFVNSCVTQALVFKDGRIAKVDQLFTIQGVVYGTTYKLDQERDIYTNELFYIEDEVNSLTLHPLYMSQPTIDHNLLHDGGNFSLIESCGHLYYTYLLSRISLEPHHYVGAKVFELNLEDKTWVEVMSLGGRAFFVNGNGSNGTWCWGTSADEVESRGGVQGDCLYFFQQYSELSELFFYSFNLVDQTWTVLASCPGFVIPYEDLVWVMPQQQQQQRLLQAREESKEKSLMIRDISHQISCLSVCQELPPRDETQESLLMDMIPLDILKMFSNFMHPFDYWSYRATCKILRSVVAPAYQQRTPTNRLPLFMFFKDQGELCVLMDPCRLDLRSSTILPSYVDPFTIVFANNGWLLNLVDQTSLQFFNPFTMVTVRDFPPLVESSGDMEPFRGIAFSTCPICSECLIVATFSSDHRITFCYLRPAGDETWKEVSFNQEGISFCPSGKSPVFLRGAFYYLDQSGYLGVFRIVDGVPSWQVYDRPQIEFINEDEVVYLVECEGELYLVFTDHAGKMPIQVFRFNYLEKDWVEVEYLENHILFVSRSSCLSIVSKDSRVRNRIYLPKIKDKGVVFYSQDTKKYHTLGSEESLENLYGVMVPSLSNCWI